MTTTARKGARLSDDGAHRYLLWRTWAPGPDGDFHTSVKDRSEVADNAEGQVTP